MFHFSAPRKILHMCQLFVLKIKNKTYMAETFLMALGVLAIVILIVMAPICNFFLKRKITKIWRYILSQSAFLSTLTLLS